MREIEEYLNNEMTNLELHLFLRGRSCIRVLIHSSNALQMHYFTMSSPIRMI